ncbi:MAG TPA: type II toxin-antitoxin system VapC family toxin [Tepidisphaeraceae bacterium]|nr:type II toxin-antitoxin system VapC family toxin [Tepidisphaeraceae bacterium]
MPAALLDTHAFLWLAAGDTRMSAAATTFSRDVRNDLHLSAASGWEIAIKHGLRRLRLSVPLRELLTDTLDQLSFQWLAVKLQHLVLVSTLPRHHNDPFDRLLVAQCTSEKLVLVSADGSLDAYGIPRIW